jgi:hypothetical protein
VRKPEKESVQTAIRLPRETYEWLKARPDGITDNIKRGLELVAMEEGVDDATRSLALQIFDLAREVSLDAGAQWHADAGAHRAFSRGLRRVVWKQKPPGVPDSLIEGVQLAPFQEREHASHPVNDADELGMCLADDVLEIPDRAHRDRVRAAREETLKEIVKLHQNRGGESDD